MSSGLSPSCPNCEAPLSGPYCWSCGQRQLDLERPFRALTAEALEAFLSLDARLLRTLWPLLRRPGFLTTEFLAGRRARYVHPFKLYFALSVLLFLALSLSGKTMVRVTGLSDTVATTSDAAGSSDTETFAPEEAPGAPSLADRVFEPLGRLLQSHPDQINRLFTERLAKTIIVVVPVFALILKLLYRRRPYIAHLIFSLHLHSFAFLAMLAGLGIDVALNATRDQGPGGGAAGLVIVVYAFLALGRFYGQGQVAHLRQDDGGVRHLCFGSAGDHVYDARVDRVHGLISSQPGHAGWVA